MQITITTAEGGFAVSVEGQEPQTVQGVEQVCEIVEGALGGEQESPEPMMDGEAELARGFQAVRGTPDEQMAARGMR